MRALLRLSAGLAAVLLMAQAASAVTCDVSPQDVGFGIYDPIGGPAVDGIGSLNVTCDSSADFTVTLSAGGGTFAGRQMSSGADELGYNLYTNASRTTVWADGIGGSSVSSTGTNVDLTIYGRVPAGQNVPAGIYVDTLTVTVIY